MTKKRLLFILTLLLLITTGSTSVHTVFENKVEETSAEDKTDSTNTECHNCNLLKEDDLIFIELRKNKGNVKDQKNKKPEIYKVLKLLKSLHLDLNSDKVLYRYLDEHGEYKTLTAREHNEYALYKQLNPGKPSKIIPGIPFFEGYSGQILNKLVVQKKHGMVNGYNDKTLQKLRKSGLIVNALPMCTYNEGGAWGAATYVVPTGISGEDVKKISSLLNLSITQMKTYHIENLSRKEMLQLLQILCESKRVTNVHIATNGAIVNY